MFRHIICILIVLFFQGSLRAESQLSLVTDDWPPYEFLDARRGELSGLSTEVILAVFEQMGLPEPGIDLYPWARAEQEALVGSVDGIYSIVRSAERQQHLWFPDEPLTTERGVLFVHKDRVDSLQIDSLQDLNKLSIGVVRGYVYSPQLWQALEDFGNFITVTQEEQLFQMLALNRFDAVVSYRNPGISMLRRLSLGDRIEPYDSFELFTHSLYLAFNRNQVKIEEVQAFSRQLVAFKKTEAYRQLLQKYLLRLSTPQ